MYMSLYKFSKTFNLKYSLSETKYKRLLHSPCQYCQKHTLSSKRTYQNVGLHNWKNGITNRNSFPLCKFCYIIRNGQTLKQLLQTICCILFRKPVMQKMQFPTKSNSNLRCTYCYTKQNLSVNRINASQNYTFRNMQPLCWTCNRMKSNLKEKKFFNHIKHICVKNFSMFQKTLKQLY